MEITYSGPRSGKGASDAWDGGHAKGSIEITDAVPASSVTMLLHMQKPLEAHIRSCSHCSPKGPPRT